MDIQARYAAQRNKRRAFLAALFILSDRTLRGVRPCANTIFPHFILQKQSAACRMPAYCKYENAKNTRFPSHGRTFPRATSIYYYAFQYIVFSPAAQLTMVKTAPLAHILRILDSHTRSYRRYSTYHRGIAPVPLNYCQSRIVQILYHNDGSQDPSALPTTAATQTIVEFD